MHHVRMVEERAGGRGRAGGALPGVRAGGQAGRGGAAGLGFAGAVAVHSRRGGPPGRARLQVPGGGPDRGGARRGVGRAVAGGGGGSGAGAPVSQTPRPGRQRRAAAAAAASSQRRP